MWRSVSVGTQRPQERRQACCTISLDLHCSGLASRHASAGKASSGSQSVTPASMQGGGGRGGAGEGGGGGAEGAEAASGGGSTDVRRRAVEGVEGIGDGEGDGEGASESGGMPTAAAKAAFGESGAMPTAAAKAAFGEPRARLSFTG